MLTPGSATSHDLNMPSALTIDEHRASLSDSLARLCEDLKGISLTISVKAAEAVRSTLTAENFDEVEFLQALQGLENTVQWEMEGSSWIIWRGFSE